MTPVPHEFDPYRTPEAPLTAADSRLPEMDSGLAALLAARAGMKVVAITVIALMAMLAVMLILPGARLLP